MRSLFSFEFYFLVSQFEKGLKMRGIIYYKRINIFAINILAVSADRSKYEREKATRFKVTVGRRTMHTKAEILAKEQH